MGLEVLSWFHFVNLKQGLLYVIRLKNGLASHHPLLAPRATTVSDFINKECSTHHERIRNLSFK